MMQKILQPIWSGYQYLVSKKIRRGLRKLTISMLVFLFILGSCPGLALATGDPNFTYDRASVASKIHVEADPTSGSFIHEYLLVVPPGRNGMQPNLKLTYNSQASSLNSIFGQGWSINIPYIERINREGSEELYSADYFYSSMNGELKRESSSDSYSTDLERDSSQYYNITDANQTGLDLTGDFTVMWWQKLESSVSSVVMGVISKDSGQPNRSYAVFWQSNLLRVQISTDGTNNNTGAISYSITPTVDSWEHWAVTYDVSAGTMEVFKNGVSQGTTSGGKTSINDSSADFRIGTTENSSNPFDGLIDELTVWDTILSDTAISDNYNSGNGEEFTGSEINLQGYWKFDNNGNGSSSNSNDLTNNNSATFSADVPFSSGGGSSTYGAKINDGSFVKYEFIDDEYWLATDKTGAVYKFGQATTTKQYESASSTFKWMLEEVRDTNDNYIKYEYYKDSGQIYPETITYTGHDSTDGNFEVEFTREARSDDVAQYYSGFSVETKYRISEIQMQIDNSWVRKYEFDYTTGDNGIKSLLDSITESGRDEDSNTTILPKDDFDYQTKTTGWTEDEGYTIPMDFIRYCGMDFGVRLADVNGVISPGKPEPPT